ncbi:nucleotide-binding universal stress UspA family protein [Kitasatospora sp. MAA4]|uniref:universal stress protein n=1 Tax=Kitasatospora sp. MAA4 TaxID=3035093 RepID=UPI0024737429|nr:universal stress protein [Kitasatospora sp. MAA4]MDH6132264.1 nucleotide-binding universal stress UspA family protein [Kitasatospora sp. MAA4]
MGKPVIVGMDSSEASRHALDWAADEANLRTEPLSVRHIWVEETTKTPDGQESPPSREAGEALLDVALARTLRQHPDLEVSIELLDGRLRDAMTEAAHGADLLVLGARGSGGFPGLLAGSTSLFVAARATCPVVVVRPTGTEPGRGGVVAGIRGDHGDAEVLAFAFDFAQRRQLPLLALHAWSYPLITMPGHASPPVFEEAHIGAEQGRLVAEVLAGWRERFPQVDVTESAVRAHPAGELVARSREHQLVVVGRHGEPHGPLGRLGSTSQATVLHAGCPVAVVPT